MNQVLQVSTLREELEAALGLEDRRAQLVLRIGYGEPEGERRPRRAVEEVMMGSGELRNRRRRTRTSVSGCRRQSARP